MTAPKASAFRAGDKVVLALGSWQGTQGVFLRFKEDAAWADIEETGGRIRTHPIVWLAHAA
jgi:hypothetical protein